MENKTQDPYTDENLLALQKEVEKLESITLVAIEDFEKKLSSLEDVPAVAEEEHWSPRLDSIEIYSMEKQPPLSESIRQVVEANSALNAVR